MSKIIKKSPIHYGDSYKYGHSGQYRPMIAMHDYMESRGGLYPATVFTGASGLIQNYLTVPITAAEVSKLGTRATMHGIPFDFKGWMHIVNKHNGFIPIRIKAVAEGSLVPVKHVLMTIESTDPKVPWAAGFVETLLMKVWYPTTITTKSYYIRKMLEKYGSPEWAMFALHAFGDRACTCPEAAEIAGFAHLASGFMGTDNFDSLDYCENFYGVPEDQVAGYSVFATEHSTTTSYGKEGEEQFVYDQLMANPDAPIMSFVADSYDVYTFTDFCTREGSRIRKLIESRPDQKFVLRPDSGDPLNVIAQMLSIMTSNGIDTTEIEIDKMEQDKILFRDFAILWGDGITPNTIEDILKQVTSMGYAAENFVFGSGGDLMQKVDRDTQKFAVKCSSITVPTIPEETLNPDRYQVYKDIDVFKDPITDPGKASKRGKVTTWFNTETKKYIAGIVGKQPNIHCIEALRLIFENGKLYNQPTLAEIRNRLI